MRVSKLILAVMAVIAVACSTEQSSQTKDVAKIGSPISRETANALLGIKNNTDQPVAYIYGKNALQEILSTSKAEGIIIYNALDKGETKFVFSRADSEGREVEDSPLWDDGAACPPNCPPPGGTSSIGTPIDDENARTWVSDFQAIKKNSAKSFLFGREIIKELLSQPGVEGIALLRGTKVSGEDAIVLVGVDKDGALLWEGMIVDDNVVCPPTCPKN